MSAEASPSTLHEDPLHLGNQWGLHIVVTQIEASAEEAANKERLERGRDLDSVCALPLSL